MTDTRPFPPKRMFICEHGHQMISLDKPTHCTVPYSDDYTEPAA